MKFSSNLGNVSSGSVILILALIFWFLIPSSTMAEQSRENAARRAAMAWLSLIDRGEYANSWEQAAALFQSAIPKDQWVETISTVRSSVGAVRSRIFKETEYPASLPGAPNGLYAVIHYDTVFENKPAAIEIVTTMLEHDGRWHVAGYFIH